MRREIRRAIIAAPNEILSILSIPARGCELRKYSQHRRDDMFTTQAMALPPISNRGGFSGTGYRRHSGINDARHR
jgi:hypothetical protein